MYTLHIYNPQNSTLFGERFYSARAMCRRIPVLSRKGYEVIGIIGKNGEVVA